MVTETGSEQGDCLSGKPGSFGEIDCWQRNVGELNKSVMEKILSGKTVYC